MPPGKTASQNSGKGKERSSSGKDREEAGSSGGSLKIWPEWSEAELAAEKWPEIAGGGKGGKGKGGGGGNASGVLFEDPEGVTLPPSLCDDGEVTWKRPSEYLEQQEGSGTAVLVQEESMDYTQLLNCNKHLLTNEVMCGIISDLLLLWRVREKVMVTLPEVDPAPRTWRPWDHIQPWFKATPTPSYNPQGRYCVRLHWMGCWRKVPVDDRIPFTDQQLMLLPHTHSPNELWLPILCKALLKVIGLSYTERQSLGEGVSVVQLLTGWVGIYLPALRGSPADTWDLLCSYLPKWVRDGSDSDADSPGAILIGRYSAPPTNTTLLLPSQLQDRIESRDLLQRRGFSLPGPSHSALMTLVRDEPLELPPEHPPPPQLMVPYYLGLKHRRHRPGTTPPTPPPTEFMCVNVVSPYAPAPSATDNDQSPSPAATSTSSPAHSASPVLPTLWMDVADIMKCFRRVVVYTQLDKWSHTATNADLTMTTPNALASSLNGGSGKKPVSSTSSLSSDSSKFNIITLDSLEPARIMVGFSSLGAWREGGKMVTGRDERPPALHSIGSRLIEAVKSSEASHNGEEGSVEDGVKGEDSKETLENSKATVEDSKETVAEVRREDSKTAVENSNSKETVAEVRREEEHIPTGFVIVERYSWRGDQHGDTTLLRLSTRGSVGGVLVLPAGKHTLRIHAKGPHGHCVHLLSNTPFSLTSEENILEFLSKDSKLFQHHSKQLADKLLEIAAQCNTRDDIQRLFPTLLDSPAHLLPPTLTRGGAQVLEAAFSHTLSQVSSQAGLTAEQSKLWSVFMSCGLDHLSTILPQDNDIAPPVDMEQLLSVLLPRGDDHPTTVSSVSEKEDGVSTDESSTAVPCFPEAADSSDDVMMTSFHESVPLLEPHSAQLGGGALRAMLLLSPRLLSLFPFADDELCHALSSSYNGRLPALQPGQWRVLFREVLRVSVPQEVVFKFDCPLSSWALRLVDQTTATELPSSLQSSQLYLLNNNTDYLLLGEAWLPSEVTKESVEEAWHLWLISASSLPTITNEGGIVTDFHTFEVKDYYLPDRDMTILRYSIMISDDCVSTVQVSTSKKDVYFKLTVYDGDTVVSVKEGCGHCVLPGLSLKPHPPASDDEDKDSKPTKYSLVAVAQRGSWSVDDSAWSYISSIKAAARSDDKQHSAKGKRARDKGARTKTPGAAPSSQHTDQVDSSKPHWTLRVVVEDHNKHMVQVVKDTEREQTLQGMVTVWETDQPGRSKKAIELRQSFLDSHALVSDSNEESQQQTDEEGSSSVVDGGGGGSAALTSSSSSLIPQFTPVPLKSLDTSQYIIPSNGCQKLLDSSLAEELEQEKRAAVRNYKEWRNSILSLREEERRQRNLLKQQQVELVEEWQGKLEEDRKMLNKTREAIRSKHERAREAESAEERARQEEAAAEKDPKGKARKTTGKKKK